MLQQSFHLRSEWDGGDASRNQEFVQLDTPVLRISGVPYVIHVKRTGHSIMEMLLQ